jgi:hypothetical protein
VAGLFRHHDIFYAKSLFKQSREDALEESSVERLKKYRAKIRLKYRAQYRLSAGKGVTAMERVAL